MRRPDRLLIWSWNAGGLTSELWQELLLTLESMPQVLRPQIVLIQESHWTEAIAPNFKTDSWTVLTSPAVDCKAAGLVMLLDKQVCSSGTLTYADPLPGRGQHARLETSKWTVDLFNVYQKPQSNLKDHSQSSKELRRQVWQVLRKQLGRIPTRHTLILGGDHNCGLTPSACAGPKADCGKGRPMPDQHLLQKLLEDHQLIQTNSWTRRKAGPTYLHHAGHSMIDHLIIRQSQADNLARQAHPIPTKLAAWRQGGRHLPIAGTYRLQTFHSLNRPTTERKNWDHWTLVQKCQDWWDPQIAQLRHLVGSNLCQVCNVDDLDRMLVAQATTVFPPVAQPCRLAVWQTPVMRGGLKAMWQAYKEWRKPSGVGLRSILQAWRSFQLFQSKQKAFRKAGKEARRQWFHNRDLQTAAQSQDTRRLYAGIRSIAPKTRKIAVQLRDSQGCLQDASTQAEQLHRHYNRVYTTPEPHTLPSPPTRIHMQVKIEEVYQALFRLPAHKATPTGKASTSLWRSCADILAPVLAQYTCAARQVPQLWRDAWLTLVPKIPRPLEPKNLRPIGLTEAGGRAIARILQERLRPHINQYLHSIPQFAYLAKRSTSHAILRVQSHCRQVQDLCSTPARKIMDAFEAKPKHCCNQGGLQLSLDLTSAIDVLSWQLISLSI